MYTVTVVDREKIEHTFIHVQEIHIDENWLEIHKEEGGKQRMICFPVREIHHYHYIEE